MLQAVTITWDPGIVLITNIMWWKINAKAILKIPPAGSAMHVIIRSHFITIATGIISIMVNISAAGHSPAVSCPIGKHKLKEV